MHILPTTGNAFGDAWFLRDRGSATAAYAVRTSRSPTGSRVTAASMRAASSLRELVLSPSRPNRLRICHHSALVREISPASTLALVVQIDLIVAPFASRQDVSCLRRETSHAHPRTWSYTRSRMIPCRNNKADPGMLSATTNSSSACWTTLDVFSSLSNGRTTSVDMWSSSRLGIESKSRAGEHVEDVRAFGRTQGPGGRRTGLLGACVAERFGAPSDTICSGKKDLI